MSLKVTNDCTLSIIVGVVLLKQMILTQSTMECIWDENTREN